MRNKTAQSSVWIFACFMVAGGIGCSTKTTGVFKVNDSEYGITVAAEYVEAKGMAYDKAKEECSRQGKEVVTISFDKVPYVYSAYELKFKCADKSSSEIQQGVK